MEKFVSARLLVALNRLHPDSRPMGPGTDAGNFGSTRARAVSPNGSGRMERSRWFNKSIEGNICDSCGATWGMRGSFTMPYAYFLNENLSDDFWTIRVVDDCSSFFPPNVNGMDIYGAYFATDGTIHLMRQILRGLDRGVFETLGVSKGNAWPV
jgi:hypothetical protein